MDLEASQETTGAPSSWRVMLDKLVANLFAPIDIASIVLFRIAFGAVMLWEVWRYFTLGRIKEYYIDPTFHFTYFGFGWVKPLPGDGMYYIFAVLGILSVFIMAGFLYRFSATLFFLGFSYTFLLEQARYLNHMYLVALISFLMIFVPAHRAFSVDSLIWPAQRSNTVPAWALWLIRAQVAVPYFFGGIAKLNEDWLIRGEPIRAWIGQRTDFPVIGQFFKEEWMVYLVAYNGMLLDLFVVFALLWHRTRLFAIVAAFAFHLINNSLFQIGIFPWFMMAGTLMFLPPNWPRLALSMLTRRGKAITLPQPQLYLQTYTPRQQHVIVALFGVYFAWQVLMPLRHHLYPGDVAWTEEGHRFSWRMKLRDKEATANYFVLNPATGNRWPILTKTYLKPWQAGEMESRPDMVLQFAHHVAEVHKRKGYERMEVHARVMVSLNGRPEQLMIDPSLDLASQPQSITPVSWIVPFNSAPMEATENDE